MTKLQRKRMRRRVLQGSRQYQVTARGWADRGHGRWFEERGMFGRSAYHHKRRAWLFGVGRRGERKGPMPYLCGQCGASGVKLWREYNTFLCYQTLRCARCCCDIEVDADGRVMLSDLPGYNDCFAGSTQRTDQIGDMRIPAVPAPGGTFWGYTSVPEADVQRWRALPTYGEKR